MPDVRTALVGYGYAGKTIHAPLIRAADGLGLDTVVSSRLGDVHADLPDVKVCDLAAALADPLIELVVIATPNELHAPQAHAALDAGKHVVIDKPFALDTAQAQSLIEHARSAGRLLSVFQCRRWDSNHLTFEAIRPRLGPLYQFAARFDRLRPAVRDRWRERAGPGSGIWFDLGAHLLDQALVLFGWPDWISADIGIQRPGASTDDYFHAVLGYGPLRVILHASMMTAAASPAIEAQGANGSYVKFGMDTQEDMLKSRRTPDDAGWGMDPVMGAFTPVIDTLAGPLESIPSLPGNYIAYYEAIARAIRHGGANPVPAEDALRVMQLLEAGRASADQGHRISL